MKVYALIIISIIHFSCNSRDNTVAQVGETTPADKGFFPVTSFIKGEIAGIRQDGINPRYFITDNGNIIDSGWVKSEDFSLAFAAFLSPEIDSTNLLSYFKETGFHDQTLGTFTFTYEPSDKLPQDFPLRRWDVYIDENTNKVKRIYLVKQIADTTLHLTWLAGGNARISTITGSGANEKLAREKEISWTY